MPNGKRGRIDFIGLILVGCGYPAFRGKVGEGGLNLWYAHIFGMVLIMKEDKPLNPSHKGFFRKVGVMFSLYGIAGLI